MKYKALFEDANNTISRQAQELAQFREAEKRRKEANEKRWSTTLYCTNCLEVHNVSIPAGLQIKNCGCINCRVKGTYLPVKRLP